MKQVKRWLLPSLTALAVLCAVLLPQQLSLLRDQTMLNGIHTELLTTDALSASTAPLTLEERIELFYHCRSAQAESSTISWALDEQSTPEEMPALREMVEQELESLEANGIISKEMMPNDLTGLAGRRVSVRLTEDLRSATFLELGVVDKGSGPDWSLVLDEETGHIIELLVFFPQKGEYGSAAGIGAGFFDRLGIDYQVEVAERDYAEFLLPEETVYQVTLDYTDGNYCYLCVEPSGGRWDIPDNNSSIAAAG